MTFHHLPLRQIVWDNRWGFGLCLLFNFSYCYKKLYVPFQVFINILSGPFKDVATIDTVSSQWRLYLCRYFKLLASTTNLMYFRRKHVLVKSFMFETDDIYLERCLSLKRFKFKYDASWIKEFEILRHRVSFQFYWAVYRLPLITQQLSGPWLFDSVDEYHRRVRFRNTRWPFFFVFAFSLSFFSGVKFPLVNEILKSR